MFEQGPSQRKGKKVRAPVKWGPFERVCPEVLRRVRELAGNGEGHVFLHAYETGETSPTEVLRIAGAIDAVGEADEPPADGGAVAQLVHGLMRSNQLLVAENREWRDRAFRELGGALEERERVTMLAMHAAMAETAGEDRRMADALEALGPTLEAVMPKVVDMLGRYVAGGGSALGEPLPADPGQRLSALAARMAADGADLARTAMSNPDAARALAAESVAALREIVAQLAGPLGLHVEPMMPPPTSDGAA